MYDDDICTISSSSATSFSSSNSNVSASSSSISLLNTNSLSPASLSGPSTYSSERIYHLLKHEKHRYDIIYKKITSDVTSYWSIFGFPAKLNQQTGSFERIIGFISCGKCKKTFVYGPNSGTNHMKSHSCVAFEIKSNTSTTKSTTISTSTQPTIDKMVLIRKTLTTGQSNVIKDLIARWVCGDIRPLSIIDDSGLRVLIQECVKFGSLYGNIDVNDLLRS
ncbi:unnamed protein product [Rotaria magnacalcarata]|uniref:Hermes trasposase DNA-binding domain-containing protein n=1 Tax=Rotaria magnacalcarata TaxID=392030 RepID=A0A816DVI6_9BILA|nr:unnamed protein product [Rotaria magnacalcarata]CAF1640891.1 unnamed protein product [Rotaria magnacalcarata]CAF3981129.1 unnamed protein product [Rotaria magnacalcarata]CAF4309194.1 unnamed protein product [Rotaria magnacalcarata]